MSITPQLTDLDKAVLRALRSRQGNRSSEILRTINGHYTQPEVPPDEMWRILRGLEHFGYASQVRGWWRRTRAGDDVLIRKGGS